MTLRPRTSLSEALKSIDRRQRGGMNLIEVVIVIAIILVLVSVLAGAAFLVFQDTKVSTTKLTMYQVKSKLTSHMMLISDGEPPATLNEVGLPANLTRDAWGNDFKYTVDGRDWTLTSLGEDGTEGGTGRGIDLVIKSNE